MGPRIYMHQPERPSIGAFDDREDATGVLHPVLLSFARKHKLVAVCCEPGYCPRGYLKAVCLLAEKTGARAYSRDYSNFSPEAASESLAKLARDIRSKYKDQKVEIVVALNLLPASDELEVAHQSRAIERMLKVGALVVLTLFPEARQLLDELPYHLLLTADDICEPPVSPIGATRDELDHQRLSRSIPVLAQTLSEPLVPSRADQKRNSYDETLAELVDASFRRSLCDEELRLRLAITVLGKGSFSDLRYCLGKYDEDFLGELASWAPFFGASFDTRTFDCVAGESADWATFAMPLFTRACKENADLLKVCLTSLGHRGEFERLVSLLPRCEARVAFDVALEWGPELLDLGELRLISELLNRVPGTFDGNDAERRRYLEKAVTAIGTELSFRDRAALTQSADQLVDETVMLCDGLVGLRELLQRPGRGVVALGESPSGLQGRLAAHYEAIDHLFNGRFGLAIETLAPYAEEGCQRSITGNLLKLDMHLAKVFSCGSSWHNGEVVDECADYLDKVGAKGLMGYVWAARLVGEALSGEPPRTVSALRSKATKSGDQMVRALSLVAECLCLLRKRPSAYVLAAVNTAETTCKSIGWTYAERVAGIIKQVTKYQLGERSSLYRVDDNDGLAAISMLIHEISWDVDDDAAPVDLGRQQLPVNEMWLLVTLSDGVGEFSRDLGDQAPVEWRRNLDSAMRTCMGGKASKKLSESGKAEPEELEGLVRINVLGEFSIWADGKRVSERMLGGRSARAVLEYLALQKGHMVGRARMAEDLWPEIAIEKRGRQKVYSATSAVRKALLAHGFGEDIFITNKATKILRLASDNVSCDVDEFLLWAKAAVESSADEKICNAALRTETLYVGDLCNVAEDGEEYFAEKRAELRKLYADAMVAGAEAALRLDKRRLAARLAGNALFVDEMREDAMCLLIRALRAGGREAEAQRRYRAYVKKLSAKSNRVPSKQLERAMNEPIGELGGLGATGRIRAVGA